MSLLVSVAAMVVSLSAFLHSRWRDRRDLLLRFHEQLITPERQRGRRLLYEMLEKQRSIDDLSSDEHRLINNTLSMYNLLGMYYQRRYVRRGDVLELWAVALVRMAPASQMFLDHRADQVGARNFQALRMMQADAHHYLDHRQISPRIPGPSSPVVPPTE
jgi:hypothetical protein